MTHSDSSIRVFPVSMSKFYEKKTFHQVILSTHPFEKSPDFGKSTAADEPVDLGR